MVNKLNFCGVILLSHMSIGVSSLVAADYEKPKENNNIFDKVISKHPVVSNELYSLIIKKSFIPDHKFTDEMVDVILILKDTKIKLSEPLSSVEIKIDSTGTSHIFANRKEQDSRYLQQENVKLLNYKKQYRDQKKTQIKKMLKNLVEMNSIMNTNFNINAVKNAIKNGKDSFQIRLPKAKILAFAENNKNIISGLELPKKLKPLLAEAMPSTNVEPFAHYSYSKKGENIGVFMSDNGCPNPSEMTHYTKLSGTNQPHGTNVAGIIRGVAPLSHIYCRAGLSFINSNEIQGSGGNPRVYITNYSWGESSPSDGYNYLDRDLDNQIWDNDLVSFVAAGNDHDRVSSPAKALNAISVGNYDDSTDEIWDNGQGSYSSFQNPSNTKNEKPEIVAPGVHITAGSSNHVYTFVGTSLTSPHAAGFAADLMSEYNWLQLRPYYFKAFLLAGSTKQIDGGVDKVGVGGLDYYRAYYNSINRWWTGSYDYWVSHDDNPDSDRLEWKVNLNSGLNVRVAIAWLNRGSYTYDHRNDSHPIGKDFDLQVLKPDGSYVCGSYSWDNPYEKCDFRTTVSGDYIIRINRYANRDTSVGMQLGASVNWN